MDVHDQEVGRGTSALSIEAGPRRREGPSFTLVKKGTDVPLAVTVTLSPDGKTATLDPTKPLKRGATYTARVSTGARDLADNPLAGDKVWTFKIKK